MFGTADPTDDQVGTAVWVYSDVIEKIAIAVQNGVGKAFSGKK